MSSASRHFCVDVSYTYATRIPQRCLPASPALLLTNYLAGIIQCPLNSNALFRNCVSNLFVSSCSYASTYLSEVSFVHCIY